MNSHENKKLHLIHSTYYFCLVKKTTVWSVNDKADRSWMSSIYIFCISFVWLGLTAADRNVWIDPSNNYNTG